MNRVSLRVSVFVVSFVLSACGASLPPPGNLPGDAGAQGDADAGQVVADDAGTMSSDAGEDAGTTTPDAGDDAGTATLDAGTMPFDAGSTTMPYDAGIGDGGIELGDGGVCSATSPRGSANFIGTTVGRPNTFALAKTSVLDGCNGREAHPGPDAVYRFTVPPGQVLAASVQSLTGDGSMTNPLYDPVVYVVEPPAWNCFVQNQTSTWAQCAAWSEAPAMNAAALAGADRVEWTNLGARPVEVFLVIDSLRSTAPTGLDLDSNGAPDFWVTGSGAFSVTATLTPKPAAPANDTCAGAVPLIAGSTTGTTVSANSDLTFDVSADGCLTVSEDQELGDVFYSATINPGQRFIVQASSPVADQNVGINLFNDICNEVLACKYATSRPGDPAVAFWDNTGTSPLTVMIQVFTMNGQTPGALFTLDSQFVPIPAGPANDTCSGAVVLTPGAPPTAGTTVGAAEDLTYASNNTCFDVTHQQDVFYSVVLPPQQRLVVTASTAEPNAFLDVNTFLGACLNVASCTVGASSGTAPARAIRDNKTANAQTVMVQVASNTSGAVGATFSVGAAVSAIPAPPANDTCAAATVLTPGTTAQGTFVGSASHSPLTANATQCAGRRTLADVFYALTVPAGATATVTVTPPAGLDTAINITQSSTSCSGVGTCVGRDDRGYSGEADIATYRNTGNSARTVLVQVLAYNGAEDTFSISAVITP